jgi:hypothetical protein
VAAGTAAALAGLVVMGTAIVGAPVAASGFRGIEATDSWD